MSFTTKIYIWNRNVYSFKPKKKKGKKKKMCLSYVSQVRIEERTFLSIFFLIPDSENRVHQVITFSIIQKRN